MMDALIDDMKEWSQNENEFSLSLCNDLPKLF